MLPLREVALALRYLVLLAEHSSDLQNLVTLAADYLRRLGLHFNARKSPILQFSGTEGDINVLLPGGGSILVSNEHKYLEMNFHASAVLYAKHEEHV